VSLGKAPGVDDLDIRGPITRGIPHFRLSPEQYQKVLAKFSS